MTITKELDALKGRKSNKKITYKGPRKQGRRRTLRQFKPSNRLQDTLMSPLWFQISTTIFVFFHASL
jgi:hypothetical protein